LDGTFVWCIVTKIGEANLASDFTRRNDDGTRSNDAEVHPLEVIRVVEVENVVVNEPGVGVGSRALGIEPKVGVAKRRLPGKVENSQSSLVLGVRETESRINGVVVLIVVNRRVNRHMRGAEVSTS
jgi:hypothetical protein